MKKGDIVQVWDEERNICLGWGSVIQIGLSVRDHEIPLIQLESGKKVWGNRVYWIEEKKAFEIGLRIFKDLKEKGVDKD